MIFALVLLVLLAVSLLTNFSFFIGDFVHVTSMRTRAGGPRLDEIILEDNGSVNKIAVVKVEGIISEMIERGGHNMVDIIRAQLKRAGEDKRVKAVLLKVNSPGGEVLASDEISRAIAELQDKTGKPVITSMGSVAASGGYYVSAPSRWIVANELTITGSIGVILSTWNYRGLMNKVGIRPMVYKSGKFKDMLSGSREPDSITEEERAMVQGLIDEVYAKFKAVVEAGRTQAARRNEGQGQPLSPDWEEYADGRVLSGSEALRLGFVDELGDFQTAVQRARKIAGIADANLVEYRPRYDLADLFGVFGQADGRVVKLDVGLEVPKLRAGQLYFLSPTVVN